MKILVFTRDKELERAFQAEIPSKDLCIEKKEVLLGVAIRDFEADVLLIDSQLQGLTKSLSICLALTDSNFLGLTRALLIPEEEMYKRDRFEKYYIRPSLVFSRPFDVKTFLSEVSKLRS